MSLHNDNPSNDSSNNNYDDDDDTVGWDSQNSIREYQYLSPVHDDDHPITRLFYRHRQRMLYISSDTAVDMPNINTAAAAEAAAPSSSSPISLCPTMDALDLNSQIQNPNHDITMREDICETPNEPHTGVKRRDYPSEGDDSHVQKRYRREPKVIPAILPEDEEATEGFPQDVSYYVDEYQGAFDAWIEGENGVFHPPPPPPRTHPHTQQVSSLRPILSGSSSNTTMEDENQRHDSTPYDQFTTISNPQHVLSAGNPSEPSQHSNVMIEAGNSSSEKQRLPNPSNLQPISPIWISDDDDECVASSVEETTNTIGDRVPLLPVSDTSSIIQRQRDDQVNNQQVSTSMITAVPTTQRRRRRHTITPAIVPSSRPRRNIQTVPASVLLGQRSYHRWTEEEVTALDEGSKRYGDDWVKIKSEYPIIANQTDVQLRRKAKRMAQKQGYTTQE